MTIYNNFYSMSDAWFNIKMWFQKKFRGYSDSEIWNLDWAFSEWMLPRLKIFRDKTIGIPLDFETLEEWQAALDDMIFAFEFHRTPAIDKDLDYMKSEDYAHDIERYERGKALFGKYWTNLWW